MPQTRQELANEIWRACDILRRDDNCTGVMEYVEHLSWLLFLKFLDDQEDEWAAQHAIAGKGYQRILDGDLRWKAWTRKDWNAEELLTFIHNDLFPYLRSLGGDPLRDIIRGIFADRNVVICASGYNLKDVLKILDGVDFHNQDDVFTVSQVYEELLRRLGSENRLAGEFYTPRPVIRFIVEVTQPQLGETVYDPACGTCGFLVEAFKWMSRQARTVDDWRILHYETFFGQEKKALPALLGTMNMLLHGITAPKVFRRNTLEENIRQPGTRYDVILTNPPFGGIEGTHIRQNFPVQVEATELLFLQHIMKKLKVRDGTRCGMVVPEGVLFRGGAFATVKQQLLEQFNLHTIVSLPPGTFAPYSDVKTALIFFERPGPTREIWYYELPLPEGLKKFSKGSPLQDEHFAEARELYRGWEAYRKGEAPRPEPTERSWVVTIDEIRQRGYDLTPHSPNRSNDINHEPPETLLWRLTETQERIRSALDDLKATLLLPAVLHQTFSQADERGWKWVRLGEVAEKPQYGYTHAAVLEPVGPKFLRISDIQDGTVDWERVPYCRCDMRTLKKYRLESGDILFARSGSVGKTFLVRELPYEAVFASYLIRIKVKTGELLPEFAFWFFQSPQYWEQIKPRGATQLNMNAKALQQLTLPLPPIDEQCRIVERIEAVREKVEALRGELTQALNFLNAMMPSVLAKAFRGEL